MEKVISQLNANLNDETMYGGDGTHLACTDVKGEGSVCAFLQKTDGKEKTQFSGKELKDLAQRIRDHKCTVCGSIPVDPGVNDVEAKGELTIDFTTKDNDQKQFECHGKAQSTFSPIEGPDGESWINNLQWKMGQDGIADDKAFPNEKPISCVVVLAHDQDSITGAAVLSSLTGSVCAIPRQAPGGSFTGKEVKDMVQALKDKDCKFGGKIAGKSSTSMALNGFLEVVRIDKGTCPA